SLVRLVCGLLAALIDRQVAVLHRQRQHAHGGAVIRPVDAALAVAAEPAAVVALVAQQHVVQLGAVIAQVVVPQLKGRLRTVIDAVEKVLLTPARRVAQQVRAGSAYFLAAMLLLAAQLQGEDARARTGDSEWSPGIVAKTAGV